MTRPRIELRGVDKRFGETVAAKDVAFSVAPGEIHALLGENGAGKSTVTKIIYGLLQPDAGELLWDGRIVRIGNANVARSLGIGMVFQHFSLFERLTVLDNIRLGVRTRLSRTRLASEISTISAAYGLPLDPDRTVRTLSVGERQRVEIVRCLLQSPRLLLMDEPTSVLTAHEANLLFAALRRVASEGCAILYISHRLGEIKSLCQNATIMRAGRVVDRCRPSAESARSLAFMMMGTEPVALRREQRSIGATKLVVRNLSEPAPNQYGTALRNIQFSVRRGEIFGIAGIAGNGQAELFAALSGERCSGAGTIELDGIEVGDLGPAERRKLGLAALPEERNGHAAVSAYSLIDNAFLTSSQTMRLTTHGFIKTRSAVYFAERVIAQFAVSPGRARAAAASLSGGNLQKFVVGREILQSPSVLIVAQPTWGVDAGAAAVIRRALFDLASNGAAVVVFSQDLDELRLISDRIAIIARGQLTEARSMDDLGSIGLLLAGVGDVAH